jgi:hypothetical protein
MPANEPTIWDVEIAPGESKPFSDCTMPELEAAARLIAVRARNRDAATGREFDEDVAASRMWVRLTAPERWLFGVLFAIKTVREGQEGA